MLESKIESEDQDEVGLPKETSEEKEDKETTEPASDEPEDDPLDGE